MYPDLTIGEGTDLGHFQGGAQFAGQKFGQSPMRTAGDQFQWN
jgi:hypothetical protein